MALLAFKPLEEPILQIIDRGGDNKSDVICLVGDESSKKRLDKFINKQEDNYKPVFLDLEAETSELQSLGRGRRKRTHLEQMQV